MAHNYSKFVLVNDFTIEVSDMALNPAYEAIGKGFVQQYYALFDDPAQRATLVNMYNVCTSLKLFLSDILFHICDCQLIFKFCTILD